MIKHNPGVTLVASHRGISAGNIPCNTKSAFDISLQQGTDIVELDVAQSIDGKLFVFHPGMEKNHLNVDCSLKEMTAKEIEELRFVNQDRVPTSYGISYLEDILSFLKDRAYINIDKFWTDIDSISQLIRHVGVEKQVIVKTPATVEHIENVKKYASDLPYMAVIKNKDEISDYIRDCGINYVGVEAIFSSDDDEIVSDNYIDELHKKDMFIFGNAIVYNEKRNISAGHTDDVALGGNPDLGWGWFLDKKFDIIQTDWCMMLKNYIASRRL